MELLSSQFGMKYVKKSDFKSKLEPTGGSFQVLVEGKCEVRMWTSKALEKLVTDVIFRGFLNR